MRQENVQSRVPMSLYRDRIEVEANRLVPRPFDASDIPRCYPYPLLEQTQDRRSTALDVVGFDGGSFSVVVCPDLGGRIIALADRVVECELLSVPSELQYQESGCRGVGVSHGLEVWCGDGRPLSMAPLQHSTQEPDDEQNSLFVFDPIIHPGVSLQIGYGFNADQRWFNVELLAVNRSSLPKPAPMSLALHHALGAEVRSRNLGFFRLPTGCVAIEAEMPLFGARIAENAGLLDLTGEMWLMPSEAILRRFRLIPLGGVHRVLGLSGSLVVATASNQVVLRSLEGHREGALYLQLEDESTVEAPVSFEPGSDWLGSLESLQARPMRLRLDLGDGEVLQTSFGEYEVKSAISLGRQFIAKSLAGTTVKDSPFGQISSAIEDADCRAIDLMEADDPLTGAPWLLAQSACSIRNGDIEGAASAADSLLTASPHNPLNWWLASTLMRERGRESDEQDPLLNAHFLAPLEPMLKVEAFLQTPVSETDQKSSILESVARNPVSALDAGLRLYGLGLHSSAVRVVEDLVRVRPSASLYYLLAGIYLQNEKFAFEANRLVGQGDELEIEPPYPFTGLARDLLAAVVGSFPKSEGASQLFELVEAFLKKELPASEKAGE